MNKLIIAAVAALSMIVPAVAVDETISPLCRDGADSAYQRDGGFCDQVASNDSLLDGKNPRPPVEE